MSGHVDVLPTLADLCGLEISDSLRRQLEGNSLRPLLEDAEAQLDESRMQVHHVGRWDDPKSWRAHKYSKASVRWKSYTLVRTDRCANDRCTRCRNIDAIPRGERRPSYTTNPQHHAAVPQGHWALYDLAADPFQTKDIAASHPAIVNRMSDHYENWWKKAEVVLSQRYGEPREPSTKKKGA
jgi:arylsulfatase